MLGWLALVMTHVAPQSSTFAFFSSLSRNQNANWWWCTRTRKEESLWRPAATFALFWHIKIEKFEAWPRKNKNKLTGCGFLIPIEVAPASGQPTVLLPQIGLFRGI